MLVPLTGVVSETSSFFQTLVCVSGVLFTGQMLVEARQKRRFLRLDSIFAGITKTFLSTDLD
jgi:hypothetical protein